MAHANAHAPTKTADAHAPHVEDFPQPPVLHDPHGAGHGHGHEEPELPLLLRARAALARFWIGLYLPAIFQGLAKSFQFMLRPKATTWKRFGSSSYEYYPDVPTVLRKGYRGEHRLKKEAWVDANGVSQEREKCVACYMCATACPAECITIVAEEAPWPDRDKRPKVFEIDLLKCIYCGMCEEACPCDAIELTPQFTQIAMSRKEKIHDKERLLATPEFPTPKAR